MTVTATVHGEEVRIYADGDLIGTVTHDVEYGGCHKLVGRGVTVEEALWPVDDGELPGDATVDGMAALGAALDAQEARTA